MKYFIAIILLLSNASTTLAVELSKDAMQVLKSTFSYDVGYPLNARVVGEVKFKNTTFEKIVFDSFHNGAVPGVLAIPKIGKAPYPVVLLMHGLTSNKSSWLEDGFSHGSKVTGVC